jgi:DNA-binding FadR family transcriptional regulator
MADFHESNYEQVWARDGAHAFAAVRKHLCAFIQRMR